ncbi:hypothetical protein G3580_01710 [Nitrogeniibacter mangrovi]|uniref:Uncharacterized protein n=1 Tax=Nitrogeniibacter mangrovi TaxID=2016596 RepID=A0A6C1B0N3_9RHOO|nr:hypothetical protein [Nitrogeniibacter mangrovi]QID16455.1 hypothetical protein G3580_01710 [Nitrogeniibacter mangrovi]
MSTGCDRFLAGRGALAELIRRQPPFEPPAAMFERVMNALGGETPALDFEPPASLEAAVLAEAARLDAAQRPRREALLEQIAHGTAPGTALEAGLDETTRRWLKQQASHRAPTPAAPPRRPWRRWLNGLGVAAMAGIAASVALKVGFDPAAPGVSAPVALEERAPAAPMVAPRVAEQSTANRAAGQAPTRAPEPSRERAPTKRQERKAMPVMPPGAPLADTMDDRLGQARPAPPALMAKSATGGDVTAAPSAAAEPARADAERSAERPMDLPLPTPVDALVARLSAHAPAHWRWIVAPQDAAHARVLQREVGARLAHTGRPDRFSLVTAPDRPDGSLRIVAEPLSPVGPRSPASPPPPPSPADGSRSRSPGSGPD